MGIEMRFEERFGEAVKKMNNTAEARMHESVNLVRNTVLETLSGSRSGRIYRVPGTKRDYVASAPGEPPAVMLADLRKSIKGGVEKNKGKVIGFVGTDLFKGPILEFGTHDNRIEPRPWLRTSFEKASDGIKEIMMRVWF